MASAPEITTKDRILESTYYGRLDKFQIKSKRKCLLEKKKAFLIDAKRDRENKGALSEAFF
ncbi:hypothetical protein QD47_21610 [Paenibacillus terrae]|uniref:Uncharacterized protein n=1 Tax=Paenibacillus terrae TaxID=159743 RepID=A0A0D7WWN3_9BACL|nr:hypothetical protein QD47_21610 [Paenibacillus terrae]